MFDHEIPYELRARVKKRHQKDAANDRKRITVAQRKTCRIGMTDQHVPWSKFRGKQAWVVIESWVDDSA